MKKEKDRHKEKQKQKIQKKSEKGKNPEISSRRGHKKTGRVRLTRVERQTNGRE